MESTQQKQLIAYLQSELAIPTEAIDLAVRRQSTMTNQLPIILWQYGLITLSQVNSIFEWLETAPLSSPPKF